MSQVALLWSESLLRASIQGGIAIAVLALAVRLWRVPAVVQVWAWRLVLAKLFITLFFPIPIQAGLVAAGTGPTGRPLLPMLIFGFSITCFLLVSALILRDLVRIHRLRLFAQPDPEGTEELSQIGQKLGLSETPPVLQSPHIQTPMLVGCGRPTVLLPTGFREEHGDEAWRMVLAHELAHFTRRDLWWTWFTGAVKAVFYFHPLVHFATAELSCAEEAACDDAAVNLLGASRTRYGVLLVNLAADPTPAFDHPIAAALAGGNRQFKRRIHLFIAQKRRHSRLVSACLLLAVLAAIPGYTFVRKPVNLPLETAPQGEVFSPARKVSSSSIGRRNTLIATTPEEGNL